MRAILQRREGFFMTSALLVSAASIVIGLLGQLAIPLPFTPIPIVTQLQAILMLGLLFGARRAASAVLLFLMQGAMGLPVFAGGAAGWAVLIGPRGGYLIGYLIAAYAVGWIGAKIKEKTALKTLLVLCMGNGIVYLFGAAHLASFVGPAQAFWLGITPFVLVDLFKDIVCLKILCYLGWDCTGRIHNRNRNYIP